MNRLKPAETYTHTHTHTHTHVVFDRLKFFTAVAAFLISISPSYSNIDSGATSADCDNATLGVESGPTNLEAQWQANTITLKWYDNDTMFTPLNNANAGTCTYDGALTVPSDTLSKTGYTFDGWTVRVLPQCWPSDIDTSENGAFRAFIQLAGYGSANNNKEKEKTPETYNLSTNGEWAAEFSYGTVKGMAKCSSKSGDNNIFKYDNDSNNWSATESELTSVGNGSYCWCQITGFDANKDGEYCSVATSSWVFLYNYTRLDTCMNTCAYACSNSVRDGILNCRHTLFSVIQ